MGRFAYLVFLAARFSCFTNAVEMSFQIERPDMENLHYLHTSFTTYAKSCAGAISTNASTFENHTNDDETASLRDSMMVSNDTAVANDDCLPDFFRAGYVLTNYICALRRLYSEGMCDTYLIHTLSCAYVNEHWSEIINFCDDGDNNIVNVWERLVDESISNDFDDIDLASADSSLQVQPLRESISNASVVHEAATELLFDYLVGNRAAVSEQIRRVHWLISAGARVNAVNSAGESMLHLAVGYSNFDVVRVLLDRNADVNARAPDGKRVIHWAAMHASTHVVRLLLERGAMVDVETCPEWTSQMGVLHGYSPSDLAVLHHNSDEVATLLVQYESSASLVHLQRVRSSQLQNSSPADE